jgi:mono/diheme cytochrome c family protein
MRNIKTIISASAIVLIVCITNTMNAQDVRKEAEKSKPVPAAVTAILEKSCIGCHSDDGSSLAKMHFNFTKWNECSAEEQTSTGQDIVKMVTKGKMPPKKFLKNNPEAKLTDAEKTTICNWAGQL